MQLSVRELARLWAVSESTVEDWVERHGLPAERINSQYRFNRAEVLEWATLRKMEVPAAFLHEGQGNGGSPLALDKALQAGGVFHEVAGGDKPSALRAVVERMPLPDGLDRGFLLQVLLGRESLGSTAMGEGIALPHPRYPVVLPVQRPFITLNFLARPVAYGAADRQPVHTLFALISPTVKVHLGLLARLSGALSDAGFRDAVRRRADADEILLHARRLEATLAQRGSEPAAEKH